MPTASLTMDIRQVGDGVRVIDIGGEVTAFSEREIASKHEMAGDGTGSPIIADRSSP